MFQVITIPSLANFHSAEEGGRAPSISVVQRWISNFSLSGSVRNQNAASSYKSSHSGRPRKRSREVIEEVSSSILRSPKRTLRKRAQCMGLSATTCWRVMRRDLKLFPYRIQTLQTLSEWFQASARRRRPPYFEACSRMAENQFGL